MTLCALSSMKPKIMVSAKDNITGARSSVLVNNTQRSVIANGGEVMRCKRKLGFLPGQSPAYPSQPASVARRNARERNRVKQVNNGFATLRSHIPPAIAAAVMSEKGNSRSTAASKKLSKVETLKMAVEYIRSLQDILEEQGGVGMLESKNDGYEVEDERYYTSSPDTVVSGENQYYPQSPERFGKSETSENSYYSPTRTIVKAEKAFQHFSPEVHETLTAEFYHARSPVKVYSSPEREPTDTHHGFLPPRSQIREHRGSASLSPPMSDACPSPTPSYSSDNSSLHPGSTSSGGLSLQLSRLTTIQPAPPPPPAPRRGSPGGYEGYDAISPEDEELLDVISWWQQTN